LKDEIRPNTSEAVTELQPAWYPGCDDYRRFERRLPDSGRGESISRGGIIEVAAGFSR